MTMHGMAIGQLTTRVAVEQRTVSKGTSGGKHVAWAARAQAWARKRDLGGGMRSVSNEGGGEVPEVRTEFVFGYRPWLVADAMRIKANALVYEITHVAHWDNQWTVVTCRTGVANA